MSKGKVELGVKIDRASARCLDELSTLANRVGDITTDMGNLLKLRSLQINEANQIATLHLSNFNFISQFSKSVVGFSKLMTDFALSLKKDVSDQAQNFNSEFRGRAPKNATAAIHSLRDSTELLTEFQEFEQDNDPARQQVKSKTDQILESTDPPADMIKAFKTWNKLIDKRRSTKRENLARFHERQNSYNQTLMDNIEGLKETISDHNKKVVEGIKLLPQAYTKFSSSLDQYTVSLIEVYEGIDAKQNIKDLCDSKGIARIDLRPQKFVPVKLPDELSDLVEEPPTRYYDQLPVGIARVAREYRASDNNQLPCKIGSSLILLEKPRQGWVLAMAPLTKKVGFVPRSAIAPVGVGAAVALKEVTIRGQRGEINIKKGQLVALARAEGRELLVETISRSRGRVPSEAMAILCSG